MTFRKLLWFLGRPSLYREMCRRLASDIRRTEADRESVRIERQEAEQWCIRNADTIEEWSAAAGMGGKVVSLADTHPAEWSLALERSKSCPVRMGGAGHLDLLHSACLHLKPEKVIETGVALGWSTLAILLALAKQGKGHLTSVDMPYPGEKG